MTLAVHDLWVRFERPILEGLNLTVESGEIVCLTGPSGSGKSTLLRVIAGLARADRGRVVWDGDDITDVAPHLRRIGLMFQDYALFPHRDVAANIGFGLRVQGRSRRFVNERVDELLRLVDLEGFGARRVATLSGGEQQRVALARALAPEPLMLLLDEPLAALDPELRERLAPELRERLRRAAMTAVVVTHSHREAELMGDRTLGLHELQVDA